MSGGNLLLRNNNILVAAGDISLNGRLFVNGDTSMNGRFYLTRDASLQSRLSVKGDVSFNSDVYMRGNIITDPSSATGIKGTFLVENAVNITGVINQSQNTLSGGYIYIPSNVTQQQYDGLVNALGAVNNVLQINSTSAGNTAQIGIGGIATQTMGSAWVSGNLIVAANSAITGTNVSGNCGPGSLYVAESVLVPNGNVYIGKNLLVQGNLNVSGTTQFSSDVSMNGRLVVSGTTQFSSDVSMNGNLVVSGVMRSNNLPKFWNYMRLYAGGIAANTYFLLGTIGDWGNAGNGGAISIKGFVGGWGSKLKATIDINIATRSTTSSPNIEGTFYCTSALSSITDVLDIRIYYLNIDVNGTATTPQYYVYLLAKSLPHFDLTVTGNDQKTSSVVLAEPAQGTITVPSGTMIVSSVLSVLDNYTIDGNVGIGTTTPAYKLDVSGTGRYISGFTATGIYPGPTQTFTITSGVDTWTGGVIGTYVAANAGGTSRYPGGLFFQTKNADNLPATVPTTKMVIDASGNVGIGQTVPTGKLHIYEATGTGDAGAASGSLVIEHGNLGGASSIIFPSRNNTGAGADYGYMRYRDDVNNSTSAEQGRLEIGTENDNGPAGSVMDALILQKNGGYVGIGTTNPGFALDVIGKAQFSSDVSINGGLIVNGNLSVQKINNQYIINQTTTNYQLIVSEDISLNGRLYVSGNVYAGQPLVSGNAYTPSIFNATAFHSFVGNTLTGQTNPIMAIYNNYATSPTVLNDPTPMLQLRRSGTSVNNWDAVANFNLSRYLHNGSEARTRLDIALANEGSSSPDKNVMTLLGNGNVGIGTTTPSKLLTVAGDALINSLTVGTGGGSITSNCAFGNTALPINTTGAQNNSVGVNSMNSNKTGSYNNAFGSNALFSNESGNVNCAFGQQALQNTTASNNTAFGYTAGSTNTTGANNTYLGSGANASANNYSNSTAIGYNSSITASNQIVLGTASEKVFISGNVGIGTTAPAYTLDVSGTGRFTGQLNALSFNATSDYRIKDDIHSLFNTEVTVDNLNPIRYFNNQSKQLDIGFLAHEVQEHYPYLVTGEKDGEQMQTLNYIGLIGILVKEIQELKSHIKKLSQ